MARTSRSSASSTRRCYIRYTGPLAICDPGYVEWRDQNEVFEQIAAYRGQTSNLTGAGEPVRVTGSQTTASLFALLGVSPALGRIFPPDAEQPGHGYEVLLSDKLWRGRFQSDASVVGKAIRLDGEFYTVVGVMPADFGFPNEAEFWTPVQLTQSCSNATLQLVARLKLGITLARASNDVIVLSRRLEQGKPPRSKGQMTLVPLVQLMGEDLRPVLMVLLAAVGLVLLIACANVANLLLARAASREREIAIRSALGASRRRIIHQLLAESLLLAFLGGALGLLFAAWGHDLLASGMALLPQNLGSPSVMARVALVGVDRWVLGFTLAVSFLTGIVFGLAPAVQASRPDLNETLKEGGGRSSAGLGRSRLRSVLVVGEIAVSLILLIGAGLLARSLINLTRVNPGFDPEDVLTMNVNLSSSSNRCSSGFERCREFVRRAGTWACRWAPATCESVAMSPSRDNRPQSQASFPASRWWQVIIFAPSGSPSFTAAISIKATAPTLRAS
ncbi:MAG: hypothetical protein DMG21_01140 [Acidobacteria bacterium]|nr:MAG: hypothetical protein DMG21_01140 [Acidobacteriota bacterium]